MNTVDDDKFGRHAMLENGRQHIRATFTFCDQDSLRRSDLLPAIATDVAGSLACALVASRASASQLRRPLGVR